MKYFKMQEFGCKCGKCHLPSEVIENLNALVECVLDPLRERYGKPIYVTSGYRCPKHNKEVSGAYNSQHMYGEAADIHCDDNKKLAKLIVEQGKFDQLILYPTFLHVSYKRYGTNRHSVLRKTPSGYATVSHRDLL